MSRLYPHGEPAYWVEYANKAWQAHRTHETQLDHILIWLGSAVVAIIGASELFGAQGEGVLDSYSWVQALVFHAGIVAIVPLYKYTQLRSRINRTLTKEIENRIIYGTIDEPSDVLPHCGCVIDHFCKSPGGRRSSAEVMRVTMVVIFAIVYVLLVAGPLMRVSLAGGGVSFETGQTVVIPLLGFAGFVWYFNNKFGADIRHAELNVAAVIEAKAESIRNSRESSEAPPHLGSIFEVKPPAVSDSGHSGVVTPDNSGHNDTARGTSGDGVQA